MWAEYKQLLKWEYWQLNKGATAVRPTTARWRLDEPYYVKAIRKIRQNRMRHNTGASIQVVGTGQRYTAWVKL